MRKKIPLGVCLTLIFTAVAIAVVCSFTVFTKIYNNLIQDFPQKTQLYADLADIDELVRSNYYGDIDDDVLDAGIAKGYLSGLNDGFSKYLTANEYKSYRKTLLGYIDGTGLNVYFDAEQSQLIVNSVVQNSPGEEAGVLPKDIILSVDGEKPDADNAADMIQSLNDEKKNTVSLEIKHVSTEQEKAEPVTVSVTKGYKASSCTYGVAGKVGYVKFSEFYENTVDIFKEALSAFEEKNVTGIIIDVRNTVSDNLEYAVEVIDVIVPMATEGTMSLVTAKNAKGEIVDSFSSDSAAVSLPIAVLTNDRTRGVAELLACDLRDFGKAKIFGEKTAGQGTMQKLFELDDGSAVILTVAVLYPYCSDCYHKVGVIPDEEILMGETAKDALSAQVTADDLQYAAALTYLS